MSSAELIFARVSEMAKHGCIDFFAMLIDAIVKTIDPDDVVIDGNELRISIPSVEDAASNDIELVCIKFLKGPKGLCEKRMQGYFSWNGVTQEAPIADIKVLLQRLVTRKFITQAKLAELEALCLLR